MHAPLRFTRSVGATAGFSARPVCQRTLPFSRRNGEYNTILASLGARVKLQKSRRGGAKRRLGGGKPFLATILLIRRDKCRDSSREMKSFIATNGKIYRDESADLSRRIAAIIAINRLTARRGGSSEAGEKSAAEQEPLFAI